METIPSHAGDVPTAHREAQLCDLAKTERRNFLPQPTRQIPRGPEPPSSQGTEIPVQQTPSRQQLGREDYIIIQYQMCCWVTRCCLGWLGDMGAAHLPAWPCSQQGHALGNHVLPAGTAGIHAFVCVRYFCWWFHAAHKSDTSCTAIPT